MISLASASDTTPTVLGSGTHAEYRYGSWNVPHLGPGFHPFVAEEIAARVEG